jgi:hypothetical protein
MKKILFLHGWSSDGGAKTAFMRSLGYDVLKPSLSDLFFSRAVSQAQAAFDEFRPDVMVGSSRGGAVAMNMDSGTTSLILLAPAWRLWGRARTVKRNCVVIHSLGDEFVVFSESVELCEASGSRLIAAGVDHRLNCQEGRRALEGALATSSP